MFKKVICFALMTAILLLPVGLAESAAVTNFTFMDTITWASTPDEVETVLDEGVERAEETDENIGTITMLSTENVSYAGHKSGRIAFTYYNDALFLISCYYAETDVTDIQLLIDEMTKIYGVPKRSKGTLLDFFNGTMTIFEWNIGDDTKIEVFQTKKNDAQSAFPEQEVEDYPYLYIVGFRNIPVSEQLEEVMSALTAAAETEPTK